MIRKRYFLSAFIAVLLNGCSSVAKIENNAVSQLPVDEARYTIGNHSKLNPPGETLFLLAFSGGGTRAAALSYGVMEELKETHYQLEGKEIRLLDDVDRISSVSGGSFTSAYYGLFGDKIFEDFKEDFLYKDVQGDLSSQILNVFKLMGRMFSTESRTEIAIDYYDEHIFKGKTFADLQASKGPLILINSTDLNSQSQFIFLQGQFDFLCSDLSQLKVARAVAASSAVPIIFPPILLKRHDNCHYEKPEWLAAAEKEAKKSKDHRLEKSAKALIFYLDKNQPPYVTLLDGGITDNLGLRTILKTVSLSGGAKKTSEKLFHGRKLPKRLVVIVVDASTSSETDIGKTTSMPSIGHTLSTVTDIQLHLYNTETSALFKQQITQWASALSTKEHSVTPYYIHLDVTDLEHEEDQLFFHQVPTSFSIEQAQADKLIVLAKEMLRQEPEYKKLLNELNASNH